MSGSERQLQKRAVRTLEKAGVIRVDRQPGQCFRVTLIDPDQTSTKEYRMCSWYACVRRRNDRST